MVFSDEDKVLIKKLYLLKNYGPAKLIVSSQRKIGRGVDWRTS